jgi:hypothetical protein
VAQLGLGHAPVEAEGRDEHDVVDAGRGGHVQHRLDDPLAVVGPPHGGQWQRQVVEDDGQAHAGRQQRWQRLAVAQRVQQGVADGAVGVVQRGQRLGWIDDPAAVGGQALQAELLAVPEQQRGSGLVDVEDEPGAGHLGGCSRTGHLRREAGSGGADVSVRPAHRALGRA